MLGFEPFDVIYGTPGNQISFPPSTQIDNFERNAHIRNQDHIAIRNDSLTNQSQFPPEYLYLVANDPNCDPNNFIRMVNREIGDNEITLENRTLPWEATLSINEKITANERNKYYIGYSFFLSLFSFHSTARLEYDY